ncbi:MAG: 3-hydroxyacyl-CoA dehydrogenase family protein [Candidatus Bathyarchaeia archaeon]
MCNDCLLRISEASSMDEAIKDADLIIVAVPENLALKQRVFKEIGQTAHTEAILATNSSSIPVSRLEESSGRPERRINLHFYSPLRGTNMVDVMGGTRTLPEVMDFCIAWVRSLGSIPLTVKKKIGGFCFNRIWRAVKKEALHLWANGYMDFRDIDRAWMIFTGMRVGPFGLMDSGGLDVVYDIETVYYEESGDPLDRPPQVLKALVDRGDLGVKAGRGLYTYSNPEYPAQALQNPMENDCLHKA